jgi:hypothetical protein
MFCQSLKYYCKYGNERRSQKVSEAYVSRLTDENFVKMALRKRRMVRAID